MNSQNDTNNGFEGIDLKSFNGRCFIGAGIFFIVAIIASFLGWYEFKGDGTDRLFTVTGWNGSVTLYGIKTYTWMGTIAIFLLSFLCMSVIVRFWQFSNWVIILVAVFCYYELAGATLLTVGVVKILGPHHLVGDERRPARCLSRRRPGLELRCRGSCIHPWPVQILLDSPEAGKRPEHTYRPSLPGVRRGPAVEPAQRLRRSCQPPGPDQCGQRPEQQHQHDIRAPGQNRNAHPDQPEGEQNPPPLPPRPPSRHLCFGSRSHGCALRAIDRSFSQDIHG